MGMLAAAYSRQSVNMLRNKKIAVRTAADCIKAPGAGSSFSSLAQLCA